MIGVLAGLLAHFVFYPVVRKTSLPDLYSYVAGVLITRPIFAKMLNEHRPVQAFDYAFARVGLGVIIARIIRTVWMDE